MSAGQIVRITSKTACLAGRAEVANTFGSRLVGLLGRDRLPPGTGLRLVRAEAQAGKPKIAAFKNFADRFPAFYVVTLGPAMLQFMRAFTDGLMPALK